MLATEVLQGRVGWISEAQGALAASKKAAMKRRCIRHLWSQPEGLGGKVLQPAVAGDVVMS